MLCCFSPQHYIQEMSLKFPIFNFVLHLHKLIGWAFLMHLFQRELGGMGNSVDLDQTPLKAVWSGYALFAYTILFSKF